MEKKLGYQKYKNLIEQMSERWSIAKELICAFCFTESSFEEDAKRFESGFLEKYIKKMKLPDKDEETWRATSWGLMQIMGQVLRENGYRGERNSSTDPVINLYYCCKFYIRLLNRYKGNKTDAIAAYNQGNNRWRDLNRNGIKDENEKYYNQEYVDKILKYEKEFIDIINNEEQTVEEKEETNIYIIKSGDSLSKIAKKFGITIEQIVETNKIEDANKIYPGQKLKIEEEVKEPKEEDIVEEQISNATTKTNS